MQIADNIIRRALSNVYFIWGRGKTTIADRLREKHGFYVYSTDDSRDWHMKNAHPVSQPYMCRNFEKEYGVKSFWELPKEVIAEREKHFVQEMTPMILVDLLVLSKQHEVILCEGDIDYTAVAPIATHAVHLRNCGTRFDWFERPDHADALDYITKRTDLSAQEKEALIQNAYASVAGNDGTMPDWVTALQIHNLDWYDNTGVDRTLADVEAYFGF